MAGMALYPRAFVRTLFSFQGRVSRPAYWLMIGVMEVVRYGAALSVNGWSGDISGGYQARTLATLLLLWPQMALTVKRGHDRGRSIGYSLGFFMGSFAGLALAAIGRRHQRFDLVLAGVAVWAAAGFYQFVEYAFLTGDPRSNRYGPRPRDSYAAKPAPAPHDDALPGERPSA
ncbi:DUF805 domain-containing protein [uncultured Caulobacter sp.]|uniref:DUF805 domain-containing protein n=1 Tax=uncultured Caulobacter sp. TaxID=158749 RepID=UPI0026206005|nr:DUF805 domain-containing protein [uncultured Caulobacter sp.]